MIIEGGDLYGDGVNIAARLEGIAAPCGISVSAKVYAEVQGIFRPGQMQLLLHLVRRQMCYMRRLACKIKDGLRHIDFLWCLAELSTVVVFESEMGKGTWE